MKTIKNTKYARENPKFNGKRNFGVMGYRLWGMGYRLWGTGGISIAMEARKRSADIGTPLIYLVL